MALLSLDFSRLIFFFFLQNFIQSGISLPSDQSPPPITLPALAIDKAMLEFSFEINDLKYELSNISVAPLDALYGSSPPIVSFSRYPLSVSMFL